MSLWLIVLMCLFYLFVLFGIAYYAEYKSKAGRSLIDHPYVYALSLTTYCTAWTFYGSVGKAATTGIGFLPTYIGPIILAGLWAYLFKIIIRICKNQRITSISDFIASRYGKSTFLGALIALVCIFSIVPYISIQLKAISVSFNILVEETSGRTFGSTGLITAILMSVFIIIFGTRNIDASKRQEGMVYAIAFEAVFKLIAFLVVGAYVTYGIYNGFDDIFQKADTALLLERTVSIESTSEGGYWDWFMLINLSFFAFMLLPRQFYLIGVQNTNEKHSHTATWLFPLYLLLINVFIIPLALGGLMYFQGQNIDADTFVLHFPLATGQNFLALLVFLGGFAAATGMIIASAYALSMMLSNNIILPVLLQSMERIKDESYPKAILNIRRISIIIIMILSYLFLIFVGKDYPLVEIGLISFVGIVQIAPAFFGAIFWRGGNQKGVVTGLILGTVLWAFTLVFPTLIKANLIAESTILSEGLFGWGVFRPYALFGLEYMGSVVHGMFWSLLFNFGAYFLVSAFSSPTLYEVEQAERFMANRMNLTGERIVSDYHSVSFSKIRQVLDRFFGKKETRRILEKYKEEYNIAFKLSDGATPNFIDHTENLLTGVVGSTAARILISKIVEQKTLNEGDILKVITDTKEAISYSKEMETKSKELEITTAQLQHANQRLQELDRLKNEFIASVTHELRTPLTSIRALSEMLANEKYDLEHQQKKFFRIIATESERLSSLIDEILFFEKLSSENTAFDMEEIDLKILVDEVISSFVPLTEQDPISINNLIQANINATIFGDKHKVKQVFINLINNAIKFLDPSKSDKTVEISIENAGQFMRISVKDNGVGIDKNDLHRIFDEFVQLEQSNEKGKPRGSGLGLAIVKKIIEKHGGKISVKSKKGAWTAFHFTLPKQINHEK